MSDVHLTDALKAVDWNANVAAFLADANAASTLASCNLRLAHWSRQFENADAGNAALCFVREMQLSGHNVAALIGLGLYKAAAGSIRTVMESALCYTYFRTHHAELATLIRDSRFFVSKAEILEFHKLHTPGFGTFQNLFGFVASVEKWYSEISAIIHGQIPGMWVDYKSLNAVAYNGSTCGLAIAAFVEGEKLVHQLFLCTVGRMLWSSFSPQGKAYLIAGLPAPSKTVLGLDKA